VEKKERSGDIDGSGTKIWCSLQLGKETKKITRRERLIEGESLLRLQRRRNERKEGNDLGSWEIRELDCHKQAKSASPVKILYRLTSQVFFGKRGEKLVG